MTTYRKTTAYQKPQGYRGLSSGPFTPSPTLTMSARGRWSEPGAHGAQSVVSWRDGTQHAQMRRGPWSEPTLHLGANRLPFSQPKMHDDGRRLRWRDAPDLAEQATCLVFGQRAPRSDASTLPWAESAERVAASARVLFAQREARGRSTTLPWDDSVPHAAVASVLWRALAARGALLALPWGPSGSYQRDTRAPYPVDPDPTDPGGSPITVPFRPVYIMTPTMTAVLLPGETPLDMLSCSISTDASQTAWRFSAAITRDALALVNPGDSADPPQIRVTVNGYAWVLAVETFTDNRRFGARTATITGASRSIMLAAPHAPLRTRLQASDRNASQLADEELGDGLSLPETGWTLVWDAVDWLVPGGTWSYADQSPLEAIGQLAAAIGARVETDRALLQLTVAPTYPVSPWDWDAATPWAIIPASILTQGDGRWQGGPNANGVYVYSGSGYGAHVTIAGSGGEVPVGMVTERILTTADPARERGRQELAAAGRIKLETITIPLFPSPADPGLLPIGKLIDVQEAAELTWRGQVQGVRIDAQREGSAFSVRQTLTVERQFR